MNKTTPAKNTALKKVHSITATFIEPEVGKHYKRGYFGITFPKTFDSYVIVNGTGYLFVTIQNNKAYQNELHYDGIVHQPREAAYLVDYGVTATNLDRNDTKKTRKARLFIRYNPKSEFEYIGDMDYFARYDFTRNKIFVKQVTDKP